MSGSLILGGLLLQDFELPQKIAWGGRQRVAVHHLPGGQRVLDSMGRDDAEITWSGVFSGTDGAARARLLDLMRAEGGTWPLIWDAFFYSVVISAFQASYERETWIPYRITCTVLRDEAEGVVEDALSLAASVLDDTNSANTILPGTGLSDLSGGITSSGDTLLAADPTTASGLLGAASAAGLLAQQSVAQGYVNRANVNTANDRG